jgi:hypothetical protein
MKMKKMMMMMSNRLAGLWEGRRERMVNIASPAALPLFSSYAI